MAPMETAERSGPAWQYPQILLPCCRLLEMLICTVRFPAGVVESPADAFRVETQTNNKTVNYCRHDLSPAVKF